MGEKLSCFYKILDGMNERDYFENFIIYNTSLVSAGLKPSATINIKKTDCKNTYDLWCKYGEEFLGKINLAYLILRDTNDSVILLVYDERILESYLNMENSKELLVELGYEEVEKCLESCLNKLKERYDICHCPHELGIFLGYPVDDVKDFMGKTNKRCLGCKYWKVYNRYNEAQKIFNLYDKAKEVTIDNIIKGNCAVNLASYLRQYFSNNISLIC